MKNLLMLPDGREISSGPGEELAIQSCTFTESVNPGTELVPGAVCAGCLEVRLYAPQGKLSVEHGTKIDYYRVDDRGNRTKIGQFYCEKPMRPSRNTYQITAYDGVTALDKDLSQWLGGLTGWPYSLQEFAGMVCSACGVALAEGTLPNGNFQVYAFSAAEITGRQLMAWVGQIAGRFCRARADGTLEFAWYTPNPIQIRPQGEVYYFQGGLSYEDYMVAPIQKVQLQLGQEDVGTIYPDTAAKVNTLKITGNYLLTTDSASRLRPVARGLYEQFKDITYTPCSLRVPGWVDVRAGDIVTVTEPEGRELTVYVMTREVSGQRQVLSCTGSPRRDSVTAVNEVRYRALYGKVLNLRSDVEGIRVENRDTAGEVASLALSLDGYKTEVSRTYATQERVNAVESTAHETQAALEGMELGGRNLLRNSMTLLFPGYAFTDGSAEGLLGHGRLGQIRLGGSR